MVTLLLTIRCSYYKVGVTSSKKTVLLFAKILDYMVKAIDRIAVTEPLRNENSSLYFHFGRALYKWHQVHVLVGC